MGAHFHGTGLTTSDFGGREIHTRPLDEEDAVPHVVP